jgi:hypothetical protein
LSCRFDAIIAVAASLREAVSAEREQQASNKAKILK